MGFRYPSHWQELAEIAFDPALVDHDKHGFAALFTALQEDRDRYLEDYLDNLPVPSGGGKRYATVVVAASNSSHHAAADADYVCTGTGDQATINNAITSLPATGGMVLLMDGTYNTTGAITLNKPGVHLCGMGPTSKIAANGAYNAIDCTTGDRQVVSDLYVTGTCTSAVSVATYGTIVRDCHFDTLSASGVVTTSANSNYSVLGNVFRNVVTAISMANVAAWVVAGNTILGNCTTGIVVNGSQFVVSGNDIVGNLGTTGISVSNATRGAIVGNTTDWATGISLGGVGPTDILVANNNVSLSTVDGIYLASSSRCKVSGNVISGAGGTSGIRLDTSCVDCVVSDNKVSTTAALTYGIRVNNANDTTNIVINNDLKGSGTTSFSDVGTGTLKALDGSANNWNRL